MRDFLRCYYKGINSIRHAKRLIRNTVVWLRCSFDRPPSRDAVNRFTTDLEYVVDDVFTHLVEQAASRPCLTWSTV